MAEQDSRERHAETLGGAPGEWPVLSTLLLNTVTVRGSTKVARTPFQAWQTQQYPSRLMRARTYETRMAQPSRCLSQARPRLLRDIPPAHAHDLFSDNLSIFSVVHRWGARYGVADTRERESVGHISAVSWTTVGPRRFWPRNIPDQLEDIDFFRFININYNSGRA